MLINKIFSVIPKNRVNQIPFILIAMIIGALLEVLGLSLIFPLIDVILYDESAISGFLISALPGLSVQNILFVCIAFFILSYFLKGIYLSFLAWLNGKFSFSVKADLNNSLMKAYLRAPYEFHLQKNSAQLIRNLTTESSQLVINVLNPILTILTEVVVIFAISIFLVVIEPIGSIIVFVFLIFFSFIFQFLFKGYIKKIGRIRQHADGMLIQRSQEALDGIKEISLLGKTQYFFEKFQIHNLATSNASAKQYFFNQIPRMYLEVISIFIFSTLLVLLVLKSDDFYQVIPILGVFSLAAFRLLPCANRIISAINSFHFAEEVLVHLNHQLTTIKQAYSSEPYNDDNIVPFTFNRSIEIENLSYHYPGTQKLSLLNINLSIAKGESIGVIGENGAGKSTLLDIITGFLKPISGTVYIDGVDIYDNIRSWREIIGYVQQDIFLIDDSISNNIAFGELADKIDPEKIKSVINEVHLDEFVSSLPEGLDTRLGERGTSLSGGQKQRIGIARALYHNKQILVFDEATSALDNKTEREIVSVLNKIKGSKTIIIISHRLSTIENCDRIIELKKGKIL